MGWRETRKEGHSWLLPETEPGTIMSPQNRIGAQTHIDTGFKHMSTPRYSTQATNSYKIHNLHTDICTSTHGTQIHMLATQLKHRKTQDTNPHRHRYRDPETHKV